MAKDSRGGKGRYFGADLGVLDIFGVGYLVGRGLAAKGFGGLGGGAFFSVFLAGHTFQDINSVPDRHLAGATIDID